MKGSHVISTFRFLEYGKPPPKGSRFKGTVNTESLIGWISYTNRDKAAAIKQEKTMHEGGLLGYTNHDENIKTYSSEGWLDDKKMKDFKSMISKAFHQNGNLCWDTVVSLRDFADAQNANMYSMNDYAAIVAKTLPSYIKNMGLDPDNILWWMNYHTNKKNPHMHIVFMEKNQTRNKGKLPQKMLDKYKSLWLKELGMRQEFAKAYGIPPQEFMKQKDENKKSLLQSADKLLTANDLIEKLAKVLPKEGRLSYNSKPMKVFKKEIDHIINQVLQSKDVKPLYDDWMKKVETLDTFQNKLASDNISHFKETEIEKIYTRIGNMILQQAKEVGTRVNESYDLWFSKIHIQGHTEDTTSIKVPHLNLRVDIPNDLISVDNIGYSHVDLNHEGSNIKVYTHNSIIESWKQINTNETYKVSGIELRKILEHKGDVNILKNLHNPKEKNEEQMESNKDVDKKDIEKGPDYHKGNYKLGHGFGIKRSNRKSHAKSNIGPIQKGAKRLLLQDQHDKERDLEKFIREFEQQQIRSEERELI